MTAGRRLGLPTLERPKPLAPLAHAVFELPPEPPPPAPVAAPPPPPEPVASAEPDWDMAKEIAGEEASEEEGDDDEVGNDGPSEVAEDTAPVIASTARETWIFAEPRRKSRRIGYLRAGAVVPRAAKTAGTAGCRGGWYRIEPEGYVCRGKTATLDRFNPIVEASKVRPKLDGLPYDYVMSRMPTPPLYSRLPTESEQARYEPDRRYHQKKLEGLKKDPAFVPLPEPGPVPPVLLYGQAAPGLTDGKPRGEGDVHLGQARVRSGFALLGQFDHDDRRFGLTTDLTVVPLDRMRWVKPSSFQGLALTDEITLPVAFVMKKHATRYSQEDGGRMRSGDALGYRDAVPLTGRSVKGGAYLEAKDGSFVRAEDVRRVEPMSRVPTWAKDSRRWVDVSILEQSLVAYEGTKPVYVTLVSTGADGLGDPKETHSTIQGVFLIHTKHVTVTMDGEDAGDEFDLRDVPFVQYFTDGYALHAAYWHDDFGTPRSHGCVNLAPLDAAWLFSFTTPDVPATWHAALSLKKGTIVYTHP
ncbi:MAG: L,D-transpeptidase [Myxococcales bacterium]|nr:L,D-transpeptidase [Myxococcales bacterium]